MIERVPLQTLIDKAKECIENNFWEDSSKSGVTYVRDMFNNALLSSLCIELTDNQLNPLWEAPEDVLSMDKTRNEMIPIYIKGIEHIDNFWETREFNISRKNLTILLDDLKEQEKINNYEVLISTLLNPSDTTFFKKIIENYSSKLSIEQIMQKAKDNMIEIKKNYDYTKRPPTLDIFIKNLYKYKNLDIALEKTNENICKIARKKVFPYKKDKSNTLLSNFLDYQQDINNSPIKKSIDEYKTFLQAIVNIPEWHDKYVN